MLPRMPADDLAEELRLARRELKFVRAEQERLAERHQRVRRQRARLKEQVEVTSETLAALLSEAYWRSAEATTAQRILPFGRSGHAAPPAEEQGLVREVERSHLFDAAWYLRHNLDAARDGLSPAVHYVRSGGAAGRDPSELFDSERYLQRNPAARGSGLPPLVHHLRDPDSVLNQTERPAGPADAASAPPGHL